jgi:cytochrome c oxidase subunit 2
MAQTAAPPPVAAATAPSPSEAGAKPADATTADKFAMAPTPGIGMPTSGTLDVQPQFTAIGQEARFMHDKILLPVITIISVFVLILLIWVMIRYRASANPVPSKTSHNTFIEIIWTVLPVLILVAIAVPSISLLAHQYATPKADLTVKVVGNQWYWIYQYPDNGDIELTSNLLKEKADITSAKDRARTDADGPRLLAVDERMVIPAGKVVKIITTSNDVIHSFAVPAFWTKIDAVPGRLNETWIKVDRPGVYFGQCSELCGARHGYMPIAVQVVPPAEFAEWIHAKGGKMPGEGAPAGGTAAAAAEAGPAAPATSNETAMPAGTK